MVGGGPASVPLNTIPNLQPAVYACRTGRSQSSILIPLAFELSNE